MNRLLTREEQQILDRGFSELTGLPSLVLMEQAAAGMAGVVASLLASCDEMEGALDVLIISGSGNNGGDGWALARLLEAADYRVAVYDAAPESDRPGDSMVNRDAFERLGGAVIIDRQQLGGQVPTLVVDAIFGTGFRPKRELSHAAAAAFDLLSDLKEAGSLIMACDIPSGVDADTGQVIREAVAADLTCTFGRKKIGLVTHPGLLYAGEVFEFPISMTDPFVDRLLEGRVPVFELDGKDLMDEVTNRPPDGHKGQFGRALLIGGDEGMTGALILAARASEKMGVGYTMLRVPQPSLGIIASAIPSALTSAVPEEGSGTKRELPEPDVIAIGPGAGSQPWLDKAIVHLLRQPMPLVIDADGLNALARMPDAFDLLKARKDQGLAPVVLTPHPGEYLRLAPEAEKLLWEDRLGAARYLAEKSGAIVVLKGMATVIALPDGRAYLNTTGHVGLAKGGTGDVLTGMMAGLIPQCDSVEGAVIRAVYWHGLAADIAADRQQSEITVTPEDLIDALGEALES